MRIFVTGVTGFLGRSLAHCLSRHGHWIAGSGRQPFEIPDVHGIRLDLGDPCDPRLFHGIDCVIHAAHDFAPGAGEKNVQGTLRILDAASRANVARQIFLTSYSARPDAESEYGKIKYRIETAFLDSGFTVLRLGLVVGNGGLFDRLRRRILRAPLIPLIGAGTDRVALIALPHAQDATETIVRQGLTGEFALFYDSRPTTREFIRGIKPNARFLPVAPELAIAALKLASLLRIPVGMNPEQVRALRLNETAPWRSDLDRLLPGREEEFNLAYALAAFAFQTSKEPP